MTNTKGTAVSLFGLPRHRCPLFRALAFFALGCSQRLLLLAFSGLILTLLPRRDNSITAWVFITRWWISAVAEPQWCWVKGLLALTCFGLRLFVNNFNNLFSPLLFLPILFRFSLFCLNVVLWLIKPPRIMSFFFLHWLIKAPRIMSFFLQG